MGVIHYFFDALLKYITFQVTSNNYNALLFYKVM